MQATRRPPTKQFGHAVTQAVLLLCGAIFLIWLGWTSREQLAEVFASVFPGVFFSAVILGVVFMAAQGLLFTFLLAKHGNQRGDSDAISAFLISQPGKYIPGKVWSAVMQKIVLGRRYSLGGVAIANVELVVIGAIHMTALGLACQFYQRPLLAGLSIAAGLALGMAIMRLPTGALAARMPPAVARLLKLPAIQAHEEPVSMRDALGVSLALLGLNLAASFLVLLAAGDAIPAGQSVEILAIFYLGFAASFAAIPVPAGIGVREAAIVGIGLLLAPHVDGALLVSVALLARAWQLATDLLCFGLGVTMLARKCHHTKRP